ncbi:MAG: bifunctional transaldolase/phosoglucose isomerase, partial [Chloroflexi bacterium]|nr:bifunctional transaldolase/phosoglucose isomerase [Chloroflexota bacterium]
MKENPLRQLQKFGQSVWLDFIRRDMLLSGEFQTLIQEDGVSGVTSNPTIFEQAIAGSPAYDASIHGLILVGRNAFGIYEDLTVEDVRLAADVLFPVYLASNGNEGYVSLEISPHLAYDTDTTIAEARRIWQEVDRPNLMIKVPATKEGLPAIRELTREGINVNVTLLFSLERYREVIEAYMDGLEARLEHALPIDIIRSVASFFVSRIDTKVDALLEAMIREGGDKATRAQALLGEAAVASAKLAYQIYKEAIASERWQELALRGAKPQRLLWASTSTKNPAYSDVKYVEALIGPDTITTLPLKTLNAYRDHGQPAPRLEENVDHARWVLEELAALGVDMAQVAQELEDEGVRRFVESYEKLLDIIRQKEPQARNRALASQSVDAGKAQGDLKAGMAKLRGQRAHERLWRRDPSLWKQDPDAQKVIRNALGWLNVVDTMLAVYPDLLMFAKEVRDEGFRHVVHLGMGGSSLAPLLFQRSFPVGEKGLPLTVVDTTDPTTIRQVEESIPLEDTLFIVATKSGTTAETIALRDYFYHRVKELKGRKAGENFVAITDPGSPLVDQARRMKFRRVFKNFPDIGGRYSALSYFGLVPAALMGIDVGELLAQAARMIAAVKFQPDVAQNPALLLGALLGESALHGRDKVTILTDAKLETFGMWLEQLLAESTGKEGKGILPVALEPVGDPQVYGEDRVFAYVYVTGQEDPTLASRVQALRSAGFPVVSIGLNSLLDIGQEFFRWEVATAMAGAILEINPFDQPNVQESKENTNRLLQEVEEKGQLPEPEPTWRGEHLALYGDEKEGDGKAILRSLLAEAQPGRYVAFQAYLAEQEDVHALLQRMREDIRDRTKAATTLGYGPRYLHSTGQYHKGGPNTGLFLLITVDDPVDVPIPERPYTFSTFKRAQALGDLEALRKHGRRVV